MKPERWQLIDRLFHESLKLTDAERTAFLAVTCADDETLRAEIEALLASHAESKSFIETPAAGLAAELLAKAKTGLEIGHSIGPYKIISILGVGGMGEVYLARDRRLGRQVAIKLLPAQFLTNPERVLRFEMEARTASALNHPNIVTIHEISEFQGTRFIVSEFVEGKTLRDLMSEGEISVIEAIDITSQTAGALELAHKAGIVHRDIKPENLMLRPDGYLKILDFGLAKLTEPTPLSADSAAPTQLEVMTNPGMVMGTVQYMSPEQARGERIDARSDIWSLGVVLYEMLNRCQPFGGQTTSHVIVSILESEPKPSSRDMPAELTQIVKKTLRKHTGARYQSARELELDLKNLRHQLEIAARLQGGPLSTVTSHDNGNESDGIANKISSQTDETETSSVLNSLRASAAYIVSQIRQNKRSVIGLLSALVIGVSAVAYAITTNRNTTLREPAEAIDSIAVLPFINESKDSNTEYLSDGISHSIINRLSGLSNLRVASLNSALRYKGQAVDTAAVGKDLKVRAVLIGWMTTRGDSLSVRTELVDVLDNRRLWGEEYNNRKVSDLLQVQEDISQRISERLRLRLSGEDRKQLVKRPTKNGEAYQLYLQGRFYWNKYTDDGFRKSVGYFTQAIEKDPTFSLAYSGLADSYSLLGEMGTVRPAEAFPAARDYAEKAINLDESENIAG